MPESFEYANNGGRKYMFHNRHDGTFEETAISLGINSAMDPGGRRRRSVRHRLSGSVSGQRLRVSQVYANQGGRQFVDVSTESNIGRTPKSGMNAAFGDVFNDGRLSIYKTNISEPGVLVQANDLWCRREGPMGQVRRVGRVRLVG